MQLCSDPSTASQRVFNACSFAMASLGTVNITLTHGMISNFLPHMAL